MSKAIRRPVALLTAALTAGALLAGCGQQPSQIGAAAIVGDSTIPLSRIQGRISGILDEDQAARNVLKQHKLDVQARQILSIDIQHRLIAKLARKLGVSVDNRKVDQLIGRQGGIEKVYRNARDGLGVQLFDKASFLSYIRDYVLLADIGRRLAPSVSGTYDQIVSDNRAQAEDYAKRMAADPANADKIVAQAQQAGQTTKANRQVRLLQALDDAATALYGIPKGTVAVFPSGRDGTQWTTVLVRERRTDAPADPRSAPTLGRLSDQDFNTIGRYMLIPTAYRTRIQPSPRYGVWDPITLEVVHSAGESSGSIRPVHSATK